MSLIITATDFSVVAQNAVHYACKLAAAYKASVVVVHAYTIPISFNDNPMPVVPLEESRQIAQTSLDQVINTLQATYPDVHIESHLVFGDITEGVTEYADAHKPWMIVVGNSLSEDDSLWFGSNLLQLMRELPYPVLAIPHEAGFSSLKNICLACDYKNIAEHLPADDIIKLIQSTGATLQVLNITPQTKDFGTETPAESTTLQQMLAAVNPTFNYMGSDDVDDGVQTFVSQNNIDWLIVTPHKHGFIEGLFHKSRTKAITRHTHIPILALHEK